MKHGLFPLVVAVLGTVVGGLILNFVSSENNHVKEFLFNNKISYFTLGLILLFCIIIVGIYLFRNRKLKKELNQIKLEHEDVAAANGLVLYKDFAYYNPEVSSLKLYCKPCIENSNKMIRLSNDRPFYDCSSCGKRAIDHEMHRRMQEESDRNNPVRGFFS